MKKRRHISNKGRWKKICFSIPMIILLLIILFFMSKGSFEMFQRSRLASERLDKEIVEFERSKERHDLLEEDLEILRTDYGKEALIRQKYNMVKPGEEAIILVGDEVERQNIVEEERGMLGIIFDYLKFWE